jgi:uncharacterized protein (TIGR02246 family)
MHRTIARTLLVAACALFSTGVLLHSQTASSDDQAIRKQLQAYADARTRQDAPTEAMFYADDGDFLPMGGTTIARGRAEIQKHLTTNEEPSWRFTLTIEHLRLLTPDVALVDASFASQRGKGPVVYVLVKRDGTWLIAAARPARIS